MLQLRSSVVHKDFLVAQTVKHLPTMRETWVQSLGQKDLLEKEMATHSSILAWKIPWTEYSPWGRKELEMTERLHFHLKYIYLILIHAFPLKHILWVVLSHIHFLE